MPAAPVRSLIRFVWRRYPPLPYVVWVSLWTCALDGLLGRPERLVDRLDVSVVLTGLSLFLVSFFMRVVDEIRDYEYDRVHHPERELAAGVVSFSDLYLLLAITAVIILALNTGRPVGAGLLGAIMAYSLFLWWLEVRWRFYRDRMFFAIGVAIQLHVMQAIYVWIVRPDSTATATGHQRGRRNRLFRSRLPALGGGPEDPLAHGRHSSGEALFNGSGRRSQQCDLLGADDRCRNVALVHTAAVAAVRRRRRLAGSGSLGLFAAQYAWIPAEDSRRTSAGTGRGDRLFFVPGTCCLGCALDTTALARIVNGIRIRSGAKSRRPEPGRRAGPCFLRRTRSGRCWGGCRCRPGPAAGSGRRSGRDCPRRWFGWSGA